ncbi:MAG: EAL domain-containing protein [Bryobacteraceae bacterium]
MTTQRQLKYLPLLGLLASVGIVVSGIGVRNAVVAVRGLRSEVVLASTAHDDVQYLIQESRRQFVYALTAEPQSHRDPYIRKAREADAEVRDRFGVLADLDLPQEALQGIEEFRTRWLAYLQSRDQVVSLLLVDQPAEARRLDSEQTAETFESATAALQAVRHDVANHARTQTALVESTLFRLIFELLLLLLTLGSFAWALLGSRNEQNQEREKNDQLAKTARLDAHRSLVLEMTGKNEPLAQILETLCALVQQQLPGSTAAVSLFDDGQLKEIVSLAVPQVFVEDFFARVNSAGESGQVGANCAAFRTGEPVYSDISSDPLWEPLRESALAQSLNYCWSHPVLSSSGETLATVDVYFRNRRKLEGNETSSLRSAARLASVVIEHRHLYDKLAFQSQRDALTELPNRRLLQDRLERTLMDAERAGGVAAVLMIDLDWFKQVNDQFGHRAGDAVLRTVGQRLAHSIRQGDTVARVGGDEFTVVMSSVADAEEAERGARRILEKLLEPISLGDRDAQIAASIGISMYPEDGQDAATLIRHADLALYQVKSRGRHGVQLYGPQIGSVLRRRMSMETSLSLALQHHELQLHYQPQADMSRNLVGMEALIRWRNPEFGDVSPAEFIPVAEGSSLIVPIGTWALNEACRQGVTWQNAGYQPVKMAVNVSARQLSEDNFVDIVRAALTESGLHPGLLELELTETTLMEHVEESLKRLRQIRDLGVSITIDDFGTGYSSLSYLQKLPVSSVKIDLSFVRDIAGATTTIPVIQAIIDLAHGMGLKVVAEGVETEHQLQTLRGLGCDHIQGYLLSRPLPSAEAEPFLHNGTASLLQLNRQIQSTADVPAPIAR